MFIKSTIAAAFVLAATLAAPAVAKNGRLVEAVNNVMKETCDQRLPLTTAGDCLRDWAGFAAWAWTLESAPTLANASATLGKVDEAKRRLEDAQSELRKFDTEFKDRVAYYQNKRR